MTHTPNPAPHSISETLPRLPTRDTAPPRNALTRWLFSGGRMEQSTGEEPTHPWYQVVWLTGVDYFSSLAYQPGIALIAAGFLAPPATVVLVAVTLLGALPVYAQVARRSYAGQGSIAMLENLLSGWSAKIFVLVLIGFAATDFVITMTLSAADAARHATENPYLIAHLGNDHVLPTLLLLILLAIVFLIGFREAIALAAVVAIPYLVMNLIVLVAGLVEIARNPEFLSNWTAAFHAKTDWTSLFIASAIVFPRLALGLSGFETGVAVMPLVDGGEEDSAQATADSTNPPRGRIRNTRKLLTLAAVLMAFFLILSSFVTTLLIPPAAYQADGPAAGRATAYLAYQLLGNVFGSVFDISAIAILWFAGASAMAGLVNLIPRYLPRFGMAPRWVAYRRPMVIVLFVIDVIVTLIFRANVEAQGGAYATGVLVLILSAAIAVTIALSRESKARGIRGAGMWPLVVYFAVVSVVFVYTLVANIIERPDGVYISMAFIFMVLMLSAVSRYQRSRELRVSDITFTDEASAALWPLLVGKKVNLVPLADCDAPSCSAKAAEIAEHYKVTGPLAFLCVQLLDNRSEFIAPLRMSVRRDRENFVIEVHGAVAIANSIAYLSELIDPISLFLELTRQNLMMQSLRYVIWGEGETGLMVYTILVRYWEWMKDKDPERPVIYLMST